MTSAAMYSEYRIARRLFGLCACALLAACSVSPDRAVEETGPVHQAATSAAVEQRFYVAIGTGISRLQPDTSDLSSIGQTDDSAVGASVIMGMDINRRLSMELHGAELGSARFSPDSRLSYRLYGASAMVYLLPRPRREGFSFFGRAGYGRTTIDPVGELAFVQVHDTHILAGAGIEYTHRSNTALRAEYLSYDSDVSYAQLAFRYRFGGRVHPPFQSSAASENRTPANSPVEPLLASALDNSVVASQQQPAAVSGCGLTPGAAGNVYFTRDSTFLDQASRATLDRIVTPLRENKCVLLQINGHADSTGDDDYNLVLSQRRADAVAEYLQGQGFEKSRLVTAGLGEAEPTDRNATVAGRQNNRRVNLIIELAL